MFMLRISAKRMARIGLQANCRQGIKLIPASACIDQFKLHAFHLSYNQVARIARKLRLIRKHIARVASKLQALHYVVAAKELLISFSCRWYQVLIVEKGLRVGGLVDVGSRVSFGVVVQFYLGLCILLCLHAKVWS
jgi:hypothetical protein